MLTPEFRIGLCTGAGSILWVTAAHGLGFPLGHLILGAYTGYGTAMVLPFALWFVLRAREADAPAQRLTLRAGTQAGLQASLTAALVLCTFLMLYNQRLRPEWLDEALEWKVAQLRAAAVPETDIQADIVAIRAVNTPAGILRSTGLGLTVTGTACALALTAFRRRR